MKSSTLLLLAMLSALPSCKTNEPKSPPTSTLYGLPPSLMLKPGHTIHALEGDFTPTEPVRIWSDGAYREQLLRALTR